MSDTVQKHIQMAKLINDLMEDDGFSRMFFSSKMEELSEWPKWRDEIPYIQWPEHWLVKAVPPFAGAVIRYWVTKEEYLSINENVSVYLDCYNTLGSMNKPYWEVYPGDMDGQPSRCYIDETDELLNLIKIGFDYIKVKNNV